MAFSRDESWVWDFWVADDGELFHLYYLFAPKSLGDPDLRHRNARIGHATSADLVAWDDHGEVLRPGAPGDIDETATWTGSVVRGDDGLWRMFYTGSVFASATSTSNIESIGVATSDDLYTWSKRPLALRADPRWYETLGSSEWPEEAWRDPWVFRDPDQAGWHMLITARSRTGAVRSRGVIGHAFSEDLESWEVRPPLSALSTGFVHLEVPQIVEVEGRRCLIFSAGVNDLSEPGAGLGGTWVLDDVAPVGPYPIESAVPLTDQSLYSGRIVHDRDGMARLLAFELASDGGEFGGRISDPLPLRRGVDGSVNVSLERAGTES
ncbi:MAG TPA: glycosyl hydrolase family 32 [Microbacterium sp.]|uniref:glycosyl hydrolase family 32 n=1 Tax=Microbacterium sp. TaxID=51671 RepID=UPI002CBB897D|nr:glycosyl hydrolase family 32 [Microbacterium sp.]HWI31992.1 glycosyl hydrolase family 32 [Microbacterium sp.]